MVQLYSKYKEHGLDIWAFPCNQFGNQEPGTNAEIEAFARGKYGVEFEMFEKIKVNGSKAHPLFKYLKSHSDLKESWTGYVIDIPWNFGKFFVDGEGKVLEYVQPYTYPLEMEGQIREWLGLEQEEKEFDSSLLISKLFFDTRGLYG